jgi:hypothetical protein
MGPHYDSLNESVILAVKNAAPLRLKGESREISARVRCASKALAAAPVRRDHDVGTKLR